MSSVDVKTIHPNPQLQTGRAFEQRDGHRLADEERKMRDTVEHLVMQAETLLQRGKGWASPEISLSRYRGGMSQSAISDDAGGIQDMLEYLAMQLETLLQRGKGWASGTTSFNSCSPALPRSAMSEDEAA